MLPIREASDEVEVDGIDSSHLDTVTRNNEE